VRSFMSICEIYGPGNLRVKNKHHVTINQCLYVQKLRKQRQTCAIYLHAEHALDPSYAEKLGRLILLRSTDLAKPRPVKTST